MIQLCIQDPPREAHALPEHQRTILVVDDERPILSMLREILADEGHRALTASSSREALLLAAQQENSPHLLILDYMLAGSPLNGLELYDLLHERWPDVPAIIASCNAPAEEVRQRGLTLLEKPFALERLLSLLADALPPSTVATALL